MDKIKIYSWNILNPIVSINIKSWQKTCGKDSIFLSMLDNKRFTKFRKFAILHIIKEWIKNDKVIICLQEVCEEMLQLLKDKLLDCTIYDTNDKSMRVTICKGIISTAEPVILYENYIGLLLKTELFDILNVHFYWKWTDDIVKKIGERFNEMFSKKFIICGDFNRNITDLGIFLDEFDCVSTQDDIKGYTGINVKNNKKDIIDHIFISSDINASNIKIISKVKNYKIMYNFKKIYSLYKIKKSLSIWKDNRVCKDISDHKPIMISIT